MSDLRAGIDEGRCGEAPLYLMHLLAPDEAERFLEHARSCAVCRDELESFALILDVLPEAAPPLRAPKSLRRRIRRLAGAEAKRRQPLAPHRSPLRARVRRPALAGAAAIMLGAGVAIGAVSFGPSSPPQTASVRVFIPHLVATLSRDGHSVSLRYAHMPTPGAGRVYEVWVQRSAGGPPQPTTALFYPTASGTGSVTVPGGLAGVNAVMVTSEPAGGSLTPTRSPIIIARID